MIEFWWRVFLVAASFGIFVVASEVKVSGAAVWIVPIGWLVSAAIAIVAAMGRLPW